MVRIVGVGSMYIEGHKREAAELFTKTLASFAVITGIVIVVAFTI